MAASDIKIVISCTKLVNVEFVPISHILMVKEFGGDQKLLEY